MLKTITLCLASFLFGYGVWGAGGSMELGLMYLLLGAGICVALVVCTIVWCALVVGKRADR